MRQRKRDHGKDSEGVRRGMKIEKLFEPVLDDVERRRKK